jgi:hypothetical protein
MLHDQGACKDASDKKGRTPLMFATRAELDEYIRARFVRFFCERGADADIKDISGQAALNHAEVRTQCKEVVMVCHIRHVKAVTTHKSSSRSLHCIKGAVNLNKIAPRPRQAHRRACICFHRFMNDRCNDSCCL